MVKQFGNLVTFLLCVALVLTAALCVIDGQMPLATDLDRARSQVAISLDGSEFVFRSVAPNSLRICVEPATGQFGRGRICFTAGDVRDGLVIKR